jgi:hypothetical protein
LNCDKKRCENKKREEIKLGKNSEAGKSISCLFWRSATFTNVIDVPLVAQVHNKAELENFAGEKWLR